MRKTLIVLVLVVGFTALGSGTAFASHTHAMETGRDGVCVFLASDAGEEGVRLPQSVFDANPNVTVTSTNAALTHPLHVLAHKSVPGTTHGYWVYDNGESAAHCSEYVNAA
jgi:hypothetical protein